VEKSIFPLRIKAVMETMGHTEKEKIREDIELLQMTLQGTEDEFSPDDEDSEDETGLIMDVEEGSMPAVSLGWSIKIF
jgi:hypothetical protein